jgi:predicted nucleotidyltransferase
MICNIDNVIIATGLHPSRVQNVYVFGSQIYSTASETSDWDLLVVAKTPYPEKELVVDNFNIHILTLDRFLEGLTQQNIGRIECLMSPIILKQDIDIKWNLNIPAFRHFISHICSNSWVKAKKKLEQKDYYIGIKSLFHSLRIAIFAIQIIKYGKIVDFTAANYIWDKLISKNWTWQELDSEFKPLRNNLMSEFRKLTFKN